MQGKNYQFMYEHRRVSRYGAWSREHLTTLATLLGVPTGHQQMFFAMVQERYRELLERGETSPSGLIKALDDAVATYPVLAKAETAHWRERVPNCSGGQVIFSQQSWRLELYCALSYR